MASYYGNTDSTSSGNSSFRIVCEYSATDLNNGYYQYRYRFYLQVTKGDFYGSNITSSWGKTFSISGTGKYGYSSYYTKNVAYGSNFTLGSTAYAQYNASSGTIRSQISGTTKIATAPTKKYTVKYNANGGSGAPGQQTKTYGVTLKLSSTKPTRTGYSFQGWGTTASDTSVNYSAGANYTSNASITLYAIWKANTYTVKFDANGGSGAPGQQTKTYGVTLTLSSVKPTKTNYNFLGWGTSVASTTVAYAPGSIYTANSAITLYAIWELAYTAPRMTNFSVDRCTSSGEIDDTGTNCIIKFDYETDYPIDSIIIKVIDSHRPYEGSNDCTGTHAGKTLGSFTQIVTYLFNTEYSYEIEVTVSDSNGSTTINAKIPPMTFILDFLRGGKGLAIGKPASQEGFEIGWDTIFNIGKVLKAGADPFLSFQSNGRPTVENHIALANAMWLQGQLASGSFANILRMNADGQVELNWTSGGLKGRVMKEIWSGTWSSGTITIPELPYYNMFMIAFQSMDEHVIAFRDIEDGTGSNTIAGIGGCSHNTNDSLPLLGFNANVPDGVSGTKLTLYSTCRFYLFYGSTPTTSNISNPKVTKIYGVI